MLIGNKKQMFVPTVSLPITSSELRMFDNLIHFFYLYRLVYRSNYGVNQ
jgi:hypothetical protein